MPHDDDQKPPPTWDDETRYDNPVAEDLHRSTVYDQDHPAEFPDEPTKYDNPVAEDPDRSTAHDHDHPAELPNEVIMLDDTRTDDGGHALGEATLGLPPAEEGEPKEPTERPGERRQPEPTTGDEGTWSETTEDGGTWSEATGESSWPGLIVGSGVTTFLFFGLRYLSEHVESKKVLAGIFAGTAFLVLSTRFLRWCLVAGLIVVLVISSGVYAAKNWKDIKAQRVTFKAAVAGFVEVATGFGPGKDLKKMLGRGRDRTRAKELKELKELVEQSLELIRKAHPDINVKAYLEQVDTRDPDLNTLAAQVTADCDSRDHLCEATKLLSFVTDSIKYRTDPLSRPFEGDYPKPPRQTLEARAGDCEDKTILLLSLLGTLGIRSFFVFELGHAHALVCFGERVEDLLVERVRYRGAPGISYLRPVIGSLTGENLQARLSDMSPPYLISGQYCYAAETTAEGSWLGLDKNTEHLAVFDPLSGLQVGRAL